MPAGATNRVMQRGKGIANVWLKAETRELRDDWTTGYATTGVRDQEDQAAD